MDEKDQKIQEMERELEGLRQEMDALKCGSSQFRYETEPSRPGSGTFRYDQQPASPPKAKSGRIALIIAGCLAALAVLVTVLVLGVFTLINRVDRESAAMAEEMLWAVEGQDVDRAFALVYPGALARNEFDQGFEEMCAIWRDGGGSGSFELKRTSWSMNSSGGVTEYKSVYEVFSGQARFTFELVREVHGETTGMTQAWLRR